MFHLYLYPIGDSYLLVAACALALLGLLAVGPSRAKDSRPRRAALAGIRLAIILLVVLAMLRPTIVYTDTKKQSATLIVLADQSRSMSVPDAVGGKMRWDMLRSTLAGAASDLERLARDFEVKAYTFDAEAHAAEFSRGQLRLPETPQGNETAIGAVLDDVLRLEAGKRLLGVILLSDGAQRAYAPRDTAPQIAASRLKHLGYRLFTLPFGQARQGRDVAVKELLANPQVFVKNEMQVSGQIRIDGYVNHDIPIKLIVETTPGKPEVVGATTVQATADDQLVPFKFNYVPQTPGEYKVTAEAVQQPGERVTTNNQMSTFVNVLKGGLSVLYCEGDLRWEQKFLRLALDASPDIKVDYLFIDPRRKETRPADLPERFRPGKYDVYILGDIDSSAFTPAELEALKQVVLQGAGLIMLGGFHSFGPGGYATTPLADVLPVRMDRRERQNLGEPIRTDVQLPGPLKMRPTDQAESHPALTLAPTPAENKALWEKLPPLEGANRFTVLKPAAQVLAAAGKTPLLVSDTVGNGRVMAFAGDSTWHWWMRHFEAAHKRFWRQIILWLAKKDQAGEGSVWIKLPLRRLMPQQRLEFTVGAQSANGEPVADVTGEAEIVLPDGSKQPAQLIRQEDVLSGNFRDTQAPGDYRVRVTARQHDKTLGTAEARFLVIQQDLELDNASADAALMANLATMTGGERLAPEQLPDLIRRLAKATDNLLVEQETKKTFWDTWPFFLLLVALLGAEWFLRKHWGLV